MPAVRILAVALWVSLGMPPPATAQMTAEPRIVPYELGRDADYDALMRFKRVQSELIYIDKLEGEIPMDGLALRPTPEPEDANAMMSPSALSGRLVVLLLAVGLVVLIWRNWAFLLALAGRTPRNRPATPGAPAASDQPSPAEDSGLIARLRRMADREAAIVLLLKAAMERAAAANGIRVSRSETAREFLRRLPRSWVHLSALRQLVMAEELVQFGGRPLSEDTFEQCLHDAAPILAPGEQAA